MTTQQAILLGAAIVGLSIVGARVIAPYEIAAGVGAGGNPFVWRANAMTGTVEFCRLSFDGNRYSVQCP